MSFRAPTQEFTRLRSTRLRGPHCHGLRGPKLKIPDSNSKIFFTPRPKIPDAKGFQRLSDVRLEVSFLKPTQHKPDLIQ